VTFKRCTGERASERVATLAARYATPGTLAANRAARAADSNAGQGATTHGATASGSAGVLQAGRAEPLRAAPGLRAVPWPHWQRRAGIGQARRAGSRGRVRAGGRRGQAPWPRAVPMPRAGTPHRASRRPREGRHGRAPGGDGTGVLRGVATAAPAELRPRIRGTLTELQAAGRGDRLEEAGEPGADREQAQSSALATGRAEAAELGGTGAMAATGSSAGARASKARSRSKQPRPSDTPNRTDYAEELGEKGRGFTLTASSCRERPQARHHARGLGKKVKTLGTRLGLIWVIWHDAARLWPIQPSGARESWVAVGEMAAGTHGGCADHAPAPGRRLGHARCWAAGEGAQPAHDEREGRGRRRPGWAARRGTSPRERGRGFFYLFFLF
jgi:hypothetical protein